MDYTQRGIKSYSTAHIYYDEHTQELQHDNYDTPDMQIQDAYEFDYYVFYIAKDIRQLALEDRTEISAIARMNVTAISEQDAISLYNPLVKFNEEFVPFLARRIDDNIDDNTESFFIVLSPHMYIPELNYPLRNSYWKGKLMVTQNQKMISTYLNLEQHEIVIVVDKDAFKFFNHALLNGIAEELSNLRPDLFKSKLDIFEYVKFYSPYDKNNTIFSTLASYINSL